MIRDVHSEDSETDLTPDADRLWEAIWDYNKFAQLLE
jgi:hypothetical protein